MSFRFRKSIKIAPGIRVNLSKSGVSTSLGRPGATVNISKRGVRSTVGIPGTGLSYTATSSQKARKPVLQPVAEMPPVIVKELGILAKLWKWLWMTVVAIIVFLVVVIFAAVLSA